MEKVKTISDLDTQEFLLLYRHWKWADMVKDQHLKSDMKFGPTLFFEPRYGLMFVWYGLLFVLIEFMKEKLAEVLYTDIERIDSVTPFVDLGLDSILGVEWIDMINNKYCITMAETVVYEYPTIEALAKYTEDLLVEKRA